MINDYYMLGDLQDVKTTTFEEWEYCNSISYCSGEKYQSPIMMEILIRSDENDGVDYEDHELEYAGISEEWTEGAAIHDIMKYKIENLDTEALIATVDTDGPSRWEAVDGKKITSCTNVLFVYKGVEYRYMGAVSQEVMEGFLEGLAE